MGPDVEYLSRHRLLKEKFKTPSSVVLVNENQEIHVGVFKKNRKKVKFEIHNVNIKSELPSKIHSEDIDCLENVLNSNFKELHFATLNYRYPVWPLNTVYNDNPAALRQSIQADNYFNQLYNSKTHEYYRKVVVWNSFVKNNIQRKNKRFDLFFNDMKMPSSIAGYPIIPYSYVRMHDEENWKNWNAWMKVLYLNKNNNPANEILFFQLF